MPWNKKRYKKAKKECQNNINKGRLNESDYIFVYKEMIVRENYEEAKAICDILKLLKYDVAMSHDNIECLN